MEALNPKGPAEKEEEQEEEQFLNGEPSKHPKTNIAAPKGEETMKQTVAVFALALAFSAITFAHGNEKHVMGTVTSISVNSITSITVESTSKKTATVSLSAATNFQKSGSTAGLKDLKVGDKVVIHVTGPEAKLVATEVRFGTMSKNNMSERKGMDHSPPPTQRQRITSPR
jgi:hypothetical protein